MCRKCQTHYDDLWDQFLWARSISADLKMCELRTVFEQHAVCVRRKFEQQQQDVGTGM